MEFFLIFFSLFNYRNYIITIFPAALKYFFAGVAEKYITYSSFRHLAFRLNLFARKLMDNQQCHTTIIQNT